MFKTDTLKTKLATELSTLMNGLQNSYLTFSKLSSDNKGYEVSSTNTSIPSIYLAIVKDEKLYIKFSTICSMYFSQKQITEALGINQNELALNVKEFEYKECAKLLKEHSNKLADKFGFNGQDITLKISHTFSSPSLSLSINMTGLGQEKIEGLGELLKITKFSPLPEKYQSVRFAT